MPGALRRVLQPGPLRQGGRKKPREAGHPRRDGAQEWVCGGSRCGQGGSWQRGRGQTMPASRPAQRKHSPRRTGTSGPTPGADGSGVTAPFGGHRRGQGAVSTRCLPGASPHRCCSITKPCPSLCDPVDRSPPSPSVHGISQASILEQVAMPFSRGSS